RTSPLRSRSPTRHTLSACTSTAVSAFRPARACDGPGPHPHQREHLLVHRHAGSSSWPGYLGAGDDGGLLWPKGQKAVPTGVYGGGPELCRRLVERNNIITHWPEDNPGDHFVAMEVPEAHAADIRAFFARHRG